MSIQTINTRQATKGLLLALSLLLIFVLSLTVTNQIIDKRETNLSKVKEDHHLTYINAENSTPNRYPLFTKSIGADIQATNTTFNQFAYINQTIANSKQLIDAITDDYSESFNWSPMVKPENYG